MLASDSLDATDIVISRPVRTGPGGDQSAAASEVYADLAGHHEPTTSIVRRTTGADVRLTGLLMLDPLDDNGDVLDIRVGDFLEYTDFAGRPTTKREILRVEPYWCGSELDHLEIGF